MGCVLLKIASVSFFLFSLAHNRCKVLFCEWVKPDGHHRGIEYLGSGGGLLVTVLELPSWSLAKVTLGVTSFGKALADFPKTISILRLSLNTTLLVPILTLPTVAWGVGWAGGVTNWTGFAGWTGFGGNWKFDVGGANLSCWGGCPLPDLSALAADNYGIVVGSASMGQIEEHSIGCALKESTCQK